MNIQILSLTPQDSQELSSMLLSERSEYSQYFTPFSYQAGDLAQRLETAQRDRYWGIRCGGSLAGFFHAEGL